MDKIPVAMKIQYQLIWGKNLILFNKAPTMLQNRYEFVQQPTA